MRFAHLMTIASYILVGLGVYYSDFSLGARFGLGALVTFLYAMWVETYHSSFCSICWDMRRMSNDIKELRKKTDANMRNEGV